MIYCQLAKTVLIVTLSQESSVVQNEGYSTQKITAMHPNGVVHVDESWWPTVMQVVVLQLCPNAIPSVTAIRICRPMVI